MTSDPRLSTYRKILAFLACVAGVVFVGIPDYLSGYEVSLSVFYTLPVIAAVWFCGAWAAVAIAALSVAAWCVGVSAEGHVYAHAFIPVWNCAVRFIYLLITVVGARSVKAQMQHSREQMETLHGILPICTACKKIRDADGYWSELETYLDEHTPVDLSRKLCPDCARGHYIAQVAPSRPASSPSGGLPIQ